jgi:hypothetical protein
VAESASDKMSWDFSDEELRNHPSHPQFSLRAYLEREHAIMRANGAPTMAEWLNRVEPFRTPGITTDEMVAAIHESRAEREQQMDEWLK